MVNRLAGAMSPYLRSHAENPVSWQPWSGDAFAEATARDVPVFISIGYATCHWCHVMARESFSDPDVATYLNDNFVCIKVDREEHPSVDASYLAQAAAFTQGLGWPLSVFATPTGAAFHAGTYYPPEPMGGRPSFRQVLEAVVSAWTTRRDVATNTAAAVADAVRAAGESSAEVAPLPTHEQLTASVGRLETAEDELFGGFGSAPKFPVAPVLGFLQTYGADDLATRTLTTMARSPLRDRDGGFFRYATQRDWSEPHYERMLYDNALLLGEYTRAWQSGDEDAAATATGIADFLLDTLHLGWGFASGQDSESTIDGVRTEGGYYTASNRDALEPPPLDRKVLTGWNGLAIENLARAGVVLARPDWVEAAQTVADELLARHDDGDALVRASTEEQISTAVAALEDYGMLACGLIEVGCATGDGTYLERARDLIDRVTSADGFVEPQQDAVLAANGLALLDDPSEGAYPSGLSACARASRMLWLLTGDRDLRARAEAAIAPFVEQALQNPVGFGALLEEACRLGSAARQIVVIVPDGADGAGDADGANGAEDAGGADGADDAGSVGSADGTEDAGGADSAQAAESTLPERVRRQQADVVLIVAESRARQLAASGFSLAEDRPVIEGLPTLYVCDDFTCQLPEPLR
ncbi:thioredoxin domain-containing protein [Microbacterium sp. MPKO10]|uniref:thioredoxin domain-containing protein n=1 Tax=Microbacterium sp. MPKO10 TaxID=2989818 RepID=UPI002235594C|nr:DUF255 domain-containing protein [Microbacterium sp. MPKO10]MCW4457845.1 DUF255 domain-containing protein [Microbacterium sp. MPKO10]